MTREEAIDIIENKIQIDVRLCTKEEAEQYIEALTMACSAFITREQVEKMRGEWVPVCDLFKIFWGNFLHMRCLEVTNALCVEDLKKRSSPFVIAVLP